MELEGGKEGKLSTDYSTTDLLCSLENENKVIRGIILEKVDQTITQYPPTNIRYNSGTQISMQMYCHLPINYLICHSPALCWSVVFQS